MSCVDIYVWLYNYLRNKTNHPPACKAQHDVRSPAVAFESGILFICGPRYHFPIRADMFSLIIGVIIRFQYVSWGCGNQFLRSIELYFSRHSHRR